MTIFFVHFLSVFWLICSLVGRSSKAWAQFIAQKSGNNLGASESGSGSGNLNGGGGAGGTSGSTGGAFGSGSASGGNGEGAGGDASVPGSGGSGSGTSGSAALSEVAMDALWQRRVPQSSNILQTFRSRSKSALEFDESWRMSRFGVYLGQYILTQPVQASERRDLFATAVMHAARARKLRPNRVEGNYWYALSLIAWSQEKGTWTFLSNADEAKVALDQAIKADSSYFLAGPLRARGRLLAILPGFPFSFGDYTRALQDLKKSIEIAPSAKISYLYLAQTALENEGTTSARKVLESARRANASVGELEDAATRRALADLDRSLIGAK